MRREICCPWCRELFFSNHRLGKRQITCGKQKCKRQQKRFADKRYKKRNPDVYKANRQEWLSHHTDYWMLYRRNHSEYTARNREQTRLRKSLSSKTANGLQKRIDILQPLEPYMEFWHFLRFAKANRSIVPLLFAYNRYRTETGTPGGPHDYRREKRVQR